MSEFCFGGGYAYVFSEMYIQTFKTALVLELVRRVLCKGFCLGPDIFIVSV